MGSHRDSESKKCVFPGKFTVIAEEIGCDFKKSSQNKTGQVMSPKLDLLVGNCYRVVGQCHPYQINQLWEITKHHRNPKNAANAVPKTWFSDEKGRKKYRGCEDTGINSWSWGC